MEVEVIFVISIYSYLEEYLFLIPISVISIV